LETQKLIYAHTLENLCGISHDTFWKVFSQFSYSHCSCVLEVANLSNTMDEVDAALQELESQSDALYDEAQQILEEVRRDKESADTMDTSSPLADTKNS